MEITMSKQFTDGNERNEQQHASRGEGKADGEGIPRNPKAKVTVTTKQPPGGNNGKPPAPKPKPKEGKADGVPRNPKAG